MPSAVQHPESSVDWPPAPVGATVVVVSPSAGDLLSSQRQAGDLPRPLAGLASQTHAHKGHSIANTGWTHTKLDVRSEPGLKWSRLSHLNHIQVRFDGVRSPDDDALSGPCESTDESETELDLEKIKSLI